MTELIDAVKPAVSDAPATEPSANDTPVEKWYGDDHATIVESKGWKGVDDVLNGYVSLEKLQGMPEFAEYMKGIPAAVEDYKYTYGGEGDSPVSDELVQGFFKLAHEKKWPNAFVQDTIDFQLESIKAADEIYTSQQAEKKEENISAMKQKWQADYDPTITKIDAVAEKLQVKEYFEQLGIDKEPEIVNMLLTIANSDSEDKLQPGGEPLVAAKTLHDQLKEIMESEAYKERFHPDHKATMKRYMDLNMEIANAGQNRAPAT